MVQIHLYEGVTGFIFISRGIAAVLEALVIPSMPFEICKRLWFIGPIIKSKSLPNLPEFRNEIVRRSRQYASAKAATFLRASIDELESASQIISRFGDWQYSTGVFDDGKSIHINEK